MTKPIMLRAEISSAELRELKRLALDRDVNVQTLVGQIIRRELEVAAEDAVAA